MDWTKSLLFHIPTWRKIWKTLPQLYESAVVSDIRKSPWSFSLKGELIFAITPSDSSKKFCPQNYLYNNLLININIYKIILLEDKKNYHFSCASYGHTLSNLSTHRGTHMHAEPHLVLCMRFCAKRPPRHVLWFVWSAF